MKLSAEQFADLAASFRPEYQPTSRHERRRAPRMALEASLPARIVNEQQRLARAITVRVQDFSSRGLAIVHRAPLPLGTQFVVQLKRQSGGCAVMLCTVVHARPLNGDGLYTIGAEFTCELGLHPGEHMPADEVDAQLRRARDARPR